MSADAPADLLRRAILTSLPEQASMFGDRLPDARFLYLPRAHARALSFDTVLVRGIRGSGKSLWWAALQSREHRELLSKALGPGSIDPETDVSAGFGRAANLAAYPDRQTLQKLLESYGSRDIWWTIVVIHVLDERARGTLGPGLPRGLHADEPRATAGPGGSPEVDWAARVAWVLADPERAERIVQARDAELVREGRRKLILFDALDDTSYDWQRRRVLLRGLLQVLLDLRSCKAIRAKAFVRPDMLDSAEVTSFPDASKVVTNDVRLSWARTDLYGLLWQHLANAPEGGDAFRRWCADLLGARFTTMDGIWCAPDPMLRSEPVQEVTFHGITGAFMGRDRRRGFPYKWLPGHLADARSEVSPRSFLAAIREAAEAETGDEGRALSYVSLKIGVQAASAIRVAEVEEDFPWIRRTMEPLRGLVLPCDFQEIEGRWRDARVLEHLAGEERPPQRLAEGSAGLRQELETLALFERMYDGRVNMPDVYRVGFGLKRKGGVRPVR